MYHLREMRAMFTVLVCDDDAAILESLRIYLSQEGYRVLCARDGLEALEQVQGEEIHCMVLDIMMPRLDGLKTTLKLREKYNFPIILLSAKSEDTDKIAGLGFGAGSLEVRESQLVTGGLVLDTDTKEVTVDGDPVRLTAREYKILEYLMHNIGRVLSSAQIYEAVWNEPAYGTEKTVTVHIRNIREKIEINPKEPKYLKVVYGLGYKVEKC